MKKLIIEGALYIAASLAFTQPAITKGLLKGAEEKASIKCHQYFARYLNKFKTSLHRVSVHRASGGYILYWQPDVNGGVKTYQTAA